MDVSKILAELKAERAQIEEAILSLERLARGRSRGPGRPPGWMADAENAPKRRGRPPGSKNKVQQPCRTGERRFGRYINSRYINQKGRSSHG